MKLSKPRQFQFIIYYINRYFANKVVFVTVSKMQRQNSSIYRDQTSFSLATPYSDSEKEIEDIDFTQPQNSDVYFNTLDKIQKNSKKVCFDYDNRFLL